MKLLRILKEKIVHDQKDFKNKEYWQIRDKITIFVFNSQKQTGQTNNEK